MSFLSRKRASISYQDEKAMWEGIFLPGDPFRTDYIAALDDAKLVAHNENIKPGQDT